VGKYCIGTLEKISVLSLFSSGRTKNISIQLAARAILLYLEKILISKRRKRKLSSKPLEETSSSLDKTLGNLRKKETTESRKLLDDMERFLQLKQEAHFEAFSAFFTEAESFLSPLYDLRDFKVTLLHSLAPAHKYLEIVESGSWEDSEGGVDKLEKSVEAEIEVEKEEEQREEEEEEDNDGNTSVFTVAAVDDAVDDDDDDADNGEDKRPMVSAGKEVEFTGVKSV